MPDLTILAVDPATTTGWACSDGTGGVEYFGERANNRALAKMAEPERHGLIGFRFRMWLIAKIIYMTPAVLLVERQMTHHRSHLLLGLRMLALMEGWYHKLLVEEIWEAQWKPWARSCGWWRKDDELDARAMLGWWMQARAPRLIGGDLKCAPSDAWPGGQAASS